MSFRIEFDAKNNILRGTLKGKVTDAILLDCYSAAAECAASHTPCRGIWDFSDVTEFKVSNATIKQAAVRRPIIPSGHMRVVVASHDFLFGMMRMLQLLSEDTRPELLVVRTMDEAYRWLDVDAPDFAPVITSRVGE
jgi:hypothetical protein